jgi:hypothetical protein
LTAGERERPVLRVATPDDRGAVDALMKASAAALFPAYYDQRQTAHRQSSAAGRAASKNHAASATACSNAPGSTR